MNGRISIFRRSFLLCLIVLMAACEKDDEPMNAAPTIEAQILAVAENAAVDTSVGTVAANDDDELTFAITEVSRSDAFAINASTGAITVAGALDYETTAAYTLTVSVSDESLTAAAEVTINVTDVNEAPVITAQTAPFTVGENAAEGTAVGMVVATDEDEGDDDLTFAITSGNAGSVFAINGRSGAITTVGTLDFETTPSYILQITASDGSLSGTADITINMEDVNEPPMVASGQTFSVAEDAANGTIVGTVKANDTDGDNLTFSISSGNAGSVFAINRRSGAITTVGILDFETTPSYTLQITVSDGILSGTADITINMEDVNEPPTVASGQTFSVAEGAANGTIVGTVKANDTDGDNLTFSISSGNAGSVFAINRRSGAITVNGTLNYEIKQTYTLGIKVSDGEMTSTASITIKVRDEGDDPDSDDNAGTKPGTSANNAPIVNDATFMIAENPENGTQVGRVLAIDRERTPLTYAIISGNTNDAFGINQITGIITANGTIDYETIQAYTLRVEVSDGLLSSTGIITVNITNVNDNSPVVNNATFNVIENTAFGTVLGTIQATDKDGDDLTYRITSGNTGDAFAINSTGTITVNGTIDYETVKAYTLEIEVSDGSFSSIGMVMVNITSVNDNSPVVKDATFNIAENSAQGTVVGMVEATDAEDDDLTYRITSGNTGNTFAINGTGTIIVNGTIDYETGTKTYTLEVAVSDGSRSSTGTITVNVINVNEFGPVINKNNQTFSITENITRTTIGTVVLGKVEATDGDGDDLTYRITSGNTYNAFAIDGSGTITVIGIIDYETIKAYNLEVEVSDGSLSSTGMITVNITNVNDNSPVVKTATFNIAENSAQGTVVGTIQATDRDGDDLTYRIRSGNSGNAFAISNAGVLTVNGTIDHETKRTYTLSVAASDGSRSNSRLGGIIRVNITNVNDNSPVVNNTTFNIVENSEKGTVIDTLRATDGDGDDLTYRITSGNTGNAFAVSSIAIVLIKTPGTRIYNPNAPRDAGMFTVNGTIDYETTQAYTLEVEVSDGAFSSTGTVTVNVINVNDAVTKEFSLHSQNSSPKGLWSDGTTMWVLDDIDDKPYAYTLATGARDKSKEFSLNSQNSSPRDLWSDGTTMWVLDRADDKLYAYTLATGARDSSKEFDLDSQNGNPSGLWSDGTTMWVLDNSDDKLYAYTLATGARDKSKEFSLNSQNSSPKGLWSDGTTMWVLDDPYDPLKYGADGRLYAYTLATGARDKSKEFDLYRQNGDSTNLWSDGTTIWVLDYIDDKLYAYEMN